jgi:DNA-binding transcriptional MerR regulator
VERQWTVLEVARELKISEHTLRYYEKLGFLPQLERSSSGRRQYKTADLERLRFILRLRSTHMPLERIKSYLELGNTSGQENWVQRLEILQIHLRNMDAQVKALEEARTLLEGKVRHYSELLEEQHGKT